MRGLRKQIDEQLRINIGFHLDVMEIPHDSEVGKHVLENYRPVWDADTTPMGDVYNPEGIFDWLTELAGL